MKFEDLITKEDKAKLLNVRKQTISEAKEDNKKELLNKEKKLKPGTKVKIGQESKTGIDSDIPKRYRGKTGIIEKYFDQYAGEPALYIVSVSGRKKPMILYTDEFTIK